MKDWQQKQILNQINPIPGLELRMSTIQVLTQPIAA